MTDLKAIDPAVVNAVANTRISDLVEQEPELMTILAPLGLDLCCGGGHPLGEALQLHGIEAEPVLEQVALLMDGKPEHA